MVKGNPILRFEVHLISLDPAKGSEIRKTRPCLVISPDEMNKHIRTIIIEPMTSTIKNYPTRVTTTFQGK
jgi:mRNA interferase MazF